MISKFEVTVHEPAAEHVLTSTMIRWAIIGRIADEIGFASAQLLANESSRFDHSGVGIDPNKFAVSVEFQDRQAAEVVEELIAIETDPGPDPDKPDIERATLNDAVRELDARKVDHFSEPRGTENVVFGLEVNVFELERLGVNVGLYAMRIGEKTIHDAAKKAWMDGVLTGLMLAELRNA